MTEDREIARRGRHLSANARDYPLVCLPGYMAWSERKIEEGVPPATIANLEARSAWLLPEDLEEIGDDWCEDMLSDLIYELDRYGQ
jgi:hypothetical protein